ncbi:MULTISPECIES: amidase [unclassified Pseudomonas]|uniref:amidase n=1 Tax=unclassified Pseudomonas TaxID=196821 RepID=UPI000D3AFC1D|nr:MULTISPECIES: amidase [unclassified Pseudomonas]RAU47897.1 amidase [Pseudomonas sp. RIT 409]RAU55409.1 amidase [Pseudomonas sp. RIT 412]
MNERLQPGLNGAFMAEGFAASLPSAPFAASSRLVGARLAVKDVFDVEGMTCSAGNPAWLEQHVPAGDTAPVVQRLLDAGCRWVGKTVTDELTYSLAGINLHFGTPTNPAAPDRLPGGSSSGSAVAVAADYADLSLGTDCGGSIRLPASYCGLWGIRPTHGRVSNQGCFTLAPSFDTVGWFARNGELLASALSVLVQAPSQVATPAARRVWVSDDVIALLDAPLQVAFERWLMEQAVPCERLPVGTLPLAAWAEAFRTLQAAEVWQQHGEWVTRARPSFGADVAQRFAMASQVTASAVEAAQQVRHQAQTLLHALLNENGCLLMPPVPGPAPKLDEPLARVNDIRARSQSLLCMAGLAQLPQVVMPWRNIDGAPVGMSLIGAPFADESTVESAIDVHHHYINHSTGTL